MACALASGQYDGLVINEILANPRNAAGVQLDSNQDGIHNVFDDEFIEFLNTSTNLLDLSGLWLADANTNLRRHVFSPVLLPPGGSIVVFGGGSLLEFSNPPAQTASGGGLSLNNDAETLSLFSPLTSLVLQVSYQLTASHDAISLARDPDGTGAFTNHFLATTNGARLSPGFRLHGSAFLSNHPPVFVGLPGQTAFVGQELLFPVRAYDPADRDAITLSVVDHPPGSSLSSTGGVGTFTFTAAADQAGQSFPVSFLAQDPDGTATNIVAILVVNPSGNEDVWINEIHYDNVSDDSDEGVEIAGTAGSVLSDYSLLLYNGNDGGIYSSNSLSGTLDDEQCGFGAAWFGIVGVQNDTDGIALVKGSNVLQFLSYEGSLTASNGPAAGMASLDIGVQESATTPAGSSLQLSGTGTVYAAFVWNSPQPHSRGALNVGQQIDCPSPAAIALQKTVYLGHDGGASAPGSESVQGTNGAPVTYVFRVTNPGSVPVTNTSILDLSLGIPPIDLGILAGGETRTAHVETIIGGDLRNTAAVTGYGPDGSPVTDQDTAEVVEIIPRIDIQLTVYSGQDGGASCPGSGFLQATNGTPVTFCLVVENNGNTNVNAVTLQAPSLGLAPILVGTLEAGASFTTSMAATVTGSLTHAATVEGSDPNGDPVGDQDSAIVEQIAPAILLHKSVYLGHDGGASCPGSAQATGTSNAPVTFCFLVTNSGDTTLSNVFLDDPGLPGFPGASLGSLPAGETSSLYFESTLLASAINTATVFAYSVIGTPVEHAASAETVLLPPSNPPSLGYYDIVDLGTLGGTSSVARAINEHSQVVGWSQDAAGRTEAFLWQNGSMTGLGFLPGGSNSMAYAINNHGEITGRANVSASAYHAFRFSEGTMASIGTMDDGLVSLGTGINDAGDIAGASYKSYNHGFVFRSNQFVHVYPWQMNQYGNSECFGINSEGRTCGITYLLFGAGYERWWGYVWRDENNDGIHQSAEMQALGSLGVAYSIGMRSQANAINDLGQVVGLTGITNSWYPHHAFLITPSSGVWKIPEADSHPDHINPTNALMQDLGTLDRVTDNSEATAINDQGWVVGFSTTSSGTNQAFLWRNGTMLNLNSLISSNSGWVLTDASGINEHNEIVGTGLFQGQQRAYLLRRQGRITGVIPVFGTSTLVFTNEWQEVVTQEVHRIDTQVLSWAGTWGSNPESLSAFTVEYCDDLKTHAWQPCPPTSQWPIAGTSWTNHDFEAVPMRHFRIRAHE